MEKVIGFDLGTGSIGTAVRNPLKGDTLKEQLEYLHKGTKVRYIIYG